MRDFAGGDEIIRLAKACGAQAIHPGYGFLSENVEFAKSCIKADIEFIGPPADALSSMASKRFAIGQFTLGSIYLIEKVFV